MRDLTAKSGDGTAGSTAKNGDGRARMWGLASTANGRDSLTETLTPAVWGGWRARS